MTWTYNLGDLATSEKDQVRLEIGDTDINRQLLQAVDIACAETVERDFWGTCARCCEMIYRVLLSKADVRLGRSMQIQYTKSAEQYLAMAKSLRQKALGTTPPFVGGMSVSAKQAYDQDTDIVAPIFAKTMQTNPWTGGYTSDSTPPVGNEGGDNIGTFDEDD